MIVSIIIPVYNVFDYIERCIRSVIAQTYQNIECILVDDCTPDDSIEKCQQIIAGYKGPIEFKILHHKKNRGLSAARNTGTEAATGDYIYYLDSDDEITNDCIELLVSEIKRHPGVQIVMGATESIPYKEYYDLPYYKTKLYVDDNDWVRYNYYKNWPSLQVNAWNKLVKLEFLRENSLLFLEGVIHEDELWMFLVAQKLSKLSTITSKTYIHYYNPSSIMGTANKERSAQSIGKIIKNLLRNIDASMHQLQLFKCMHLYFIFFETLKRKRKYKLLLLRFSYELLKVGYLKFALYLFVNYFREWWFSYEPGEFVKYYWKLETESDKYQKYKITI